MKYTYILKKTICVFALLTVTFEAQSAVQTRVRNTSLANKAIGITIITLCSSLMAYKWHEVYTLHNKEKAAKAKRQQHDVRTSEDFAEVLRGIPEEAANRGQLRQAKNQGIFFTILSAFAMLFCVDLIRG